jgi:hypothetical protein
LYILWAFRIVHIRPFGIFYGRLGTLWSFGIRFAHFGTLWQEKSGNPGAVYTQKNYSVSRPKLEAFLVLSYVHTTQAGLPDGLFSNQKYQLGNFWGVF